MSFRPYSEYKGSGSRWLGELPSHWKVKRLRFVARLNPSKREASHLPRDTEVSFLPMSAVGEDGLFDRENVRTLLEVEDGYTYFSDNDVVIAKVTPCFENGKGAHLRGLIGGRGFGTTELTVIRANDANDAAYIYWLLTSRAFRGPAQAEMIGAGGLKRVPDEFFKNYLVPRPPMEERDAITSFLQREVASLDALIAEAAGDLAGTYGEGSLLALLQERRAALISAAVTGKIDVRDVGSKAEAA